LVKEELRVDFVDIVAVWLLGFKLVVTVDVDIMGLGA
jgi:hypothetical protein